MYLHHLICTTVNKARTTISTTSVDVFDRLKDATDRIEAIGEEEGNGWGAERQKSDIDTRVVIKHTQTPSGYVVVYEIVTLRVNLGVIK